MSHTKADPPIGNIVVHRLVRKQTKKKLTKRKTARLSYHLLRLLFIENEFGGEMCFFGGALRHHVEINKVRYYIIMYAQRADHMFRSEMKMFDFYFDYIKSIGAM